MLAIAKLGLVATGLAAVYCGASLWLVVPVVMLARYAMAYALRGE